MFAREFFLIFKSFKNYAMNFFKRNYFDQFFGFFEAVKIEQNKNLAIDLDETQRNIY